MTSEHVLVVLPRAFRPRVETVDAQNTFVGPMLGERGFQGAWEAPAGDRPILLVSFGSTFTDRPEAYGEVVRAFADGAWHVVLCVGRHVDPAVLGELPATVEVHRSIPQLDVLSKADAFVSHGGMGGTLEALSHGVPIVAVPEIPEQRVVARQLETLGIGSGLRLDQVTADCCEPASTGLRRMPASPNGWPRCNARSMRPAERAQPPISSKASRRRALKGNAQPTSELAAPGQRCLARATK